MPDPTEQDVTEQDFDDAFDEFSGGESALEQEEQHQDDDTQESEAQDEQEQEQDATGDNEDVADDAPAEVSELDKYKQEAQQWQHRYNSDMGRQAALQRKIQELEQQNQQLQKAPTANPDGSGMSDEQWDTLKEDFPEIAGAVEKRINGMSSQYEKQITELQGQMAPIQEQAQQTYLKSQFNILEQQHPDYKDVANSDEFNQWVANQPPSIQQLKGSNEAADAAYLLSTYKLHNGQSEQRVADLAAQRTRKLNQAKAIPGRAARNKPTLSEDDFDAAFDHYAK
jgi:hypothetical protein